MYIPFNQTLKYYESIYNIDISGLNTVVEANIEKQVPTLRDNTDHPYVAYTNYDTSGISIKHYDPSIKRWVDVNKPQQLGDNITLQMSPNLDTATVYNKAKFNDISGSYLGIHRDASLNSESFTITGWFTPLAVDNFSTEGNYLISSIENITKERKRWI